MRSTSRPASRAAENEWPAADEYLDGVTDAHADVPPLGDVSMAEDEAQPLDDLLCQVTDLLSQMHELCQDE